MKQNLDFFKEMYFQRLYQNLGSMLHWTFITLYTTSVLVDRPNFFPKLFKTFTQSSYQSPFERMIKYEVWVGLVFFLL